jgi:hypothetical protein
METCTKTRPICLNRPKNKGPIVEKCDGTPYTPIAELTTLAQYAVEEPENRSAGENNNCYAFDLAWFVVIEDIIRRCDILKGSSKIDPSKIDEAALEKTNASLPNFDFHALFTQIVKVGKKKWNTDGKGDCDDNSAECMANTIMKEYADLLADPNFIKVCDEFKTASITKEDLTALDLNTEKIKEQIDSIKDLFKYTVPIMNQAGDLTNSLIEKDTEAINKKFAAIKQLFVESSQAGGKRRKSKKNKRKSKKSKSSKRRAKKRKTRKIKQAGGKITGILGGIIVGFLLILSAPVTFVSIMGSFSWVSGTTDIVMGK